MNKNKEDQLVPIISSSCGKNALYINRDISKTKKNSKIVKHFNNFSLENTSYAQHVSTINKTIEQLNSKDLIVLWKSQNEVKLRTIRKDLIFLKQLFQERKEMLAFLIFAKAKTKIGHFQMQKLILLFEGKHSWFLK